MKRFITRQTMVGNRAAVLAVSFVAVAMLSVIGAGSGNAATGGYASST